MIQIDERIDMRIIGFCSKKNSMWLLFTCGSLSDNIILRMCETIVLIRVTTIRTNQSASVLSLSIVYFQSFFLIFNGAPTSLNILAIFPALTAAEDLDLPGFSWAFSSYLIFI